ncbi:MAG: cupin domain-containing protein [Jatrophihabitantaceae bacterium]
MRIVHREELATLRTVVVDSVEQNLGILKRFDGHKAIEEFIPKDARLSMAWVGLQPGEFLSTHVHPIGSMIVVAHGEGRTVGDLEEDFSDGDIVVIPAGCEHGFVGRGEHGFWALSIQFEMRGLYSDLDNPLADFGALEQAPERPSLQLLLERNSGYAEAHRQNPLADLLRRGLLDNPRRRSRFLDVIQVWSSHFQRAMLARSAFTDDPTFSDVFRVHLAEEFGHDTALQGDRGPDAESVWDPLLEAGANWFALKMVTSDAADKAVLVHFVLEGGAEVIAPLGAEVFDGLGETDYFDKHSAADEQHRAMVDSLLGDLDERTYRRLLDTQRKGWEMLELVSSRIAELSGWPD